MRLKSLIKFSVAAYAAGAIVACDKIPALGQSGDEQNKSQALTGGNGFSGGKAEMGEGVPEAAMTSILGLWRGSCRAPDKSQEGGDDPAATQEDSATDTSDPAAETTASGEPAVEPIPLLEDESKPEEYKVDEIRFTREGAVRKSVMYSDEGCAEKAMDITFHFNYKIGGEVADVAGARDIDFKAAGGEMVVHSSDMVTKFNENSMCGKSDWAVGEPADMKDIDLEKCGGKKDEEEPAAEVDPNSEVPDQTVAALIASGSQLPPKMPAGSPPPPPRDGLGGPRAPDGGNGDKGLPPEGQLMVDIYKVDGDKLFMGLHDGPERPSALDTDGALNKTAE